MQEIGEVLGGVSRQYVSSLMKKHGVKADSAGSFYVSCDLCKKKYKITRSRWRKLKNKFCSTDCYYRFKSQKSLTHNVYGKSERQWQRLARSSYEKIHGIKIPEGAVIHHVNGDYSDLSRENLLMFANQSDHMKFHYKR